MDHVKKLLARLMGSKHFADIPIILYILWLICLVCAGDWRAEFCFWTVGAMIIVPSTIGVLMMMAALVGCLRTPCRCRY